MPRIRQPKPTEVPDAVLDQGAPAGPLTAAAVEAARRRCNKARIARALGGAWTPPLGDPPGGTTPETPPNHRNGPSGQPVRPDDGSRAASPASTIRSWRGTRAG
jgi:hypothetical protein